MREAFCDANLPVESLNVLINKSRNFFGGGVQASKPFLQCGTLEAALAGFLSQQREPRGHAVNFCADAFQFQNLGRLSAKSLAETVKSQIENDTRRAIGHR